MIDQDTLNRLTIGVAGEFLPPHKAANYARQGIPASLWLSLHATHLSFNRYERRLDIRITHLLRADQLGAPGAVRLMEQLSVPLAGPEKPMWSMPKITNRIEHFSNRGLLNVYKRRRSHADLGWVRFNTSGLGLVACAVANRAGAEMPSPKLFQTWLANPKHTLVSSGLQDVFDLHSTLHRWWVTEGRAFKRYYPTKAAFEYALVQTRHAHLI